MKEYEYALDLIDKEPVFYPTPEQIKEQIAHVESQGVEFRDKLDRKEAFLITRAKIATAIYLSESYGNIYKRPSNKT